MKNVVSIQEVNPSFTNRRNFLKISGLTLVGTSLLLAGCNNDDYENNPANQFPGVRNGVFDLGGGDFGVLTYAYALEQLEADFYTKVVNSSGFTTNFTAQDQAVLTDLYRHEVIHREFFKTALTGALPDPNTQLLPTLAFDYGTLNFSNRTQVLATAKALEDTGVAAYNGAGKLIKSPDYLLLAGKIVSVEARHASAIRSLINPNSKDFAGDDVVNGTTGLDVASNPSQILPVAGGFITTNFTAQYLP
ncbi:MULTISPECIES: ferritin-like domain-containing protein [Flavobacterium]|uniref:Ferritin-like domain-containing protein n=1 Tax=Flavobacterium ranwuense TaxID=2541725 RepID=A0ABY2DW80_9FLAO|nr:MULTISPECIES: ferritin-like domain-containing protein [Flavobacterium]TDE31887.1 ferritin-like domain-containing protein [Flavobacterium ranwuense]TDE54818.1 ferritin-like domain-containing protein [Flavobacterium sp. GT3P67]